MTADTLLHSVTSETAREPFNRLAPGEIHLWYCDPGWSGHTRRLSAYRRLLDAEEWARCRRFHDERLRRDYLVSHAMLRMALSTYMGCEARDIRFEAGAFGKPEISQTTCTMPLRFNLSHADGLAVCAIAWGGALGVDVETTADHAAAAACIRYFNESERAAIGHPGAGWVFRFFGRWTLKEACLKACGCGLSWGLDAAVIDISGDRVAVRFGDGLENERQSWRCWLFAPAIGYRCALARRIPKANGAVESIILRPYGGSSTAAWRLLASP